jgi:hypothetical protein
MDRSKTATTGLSVERHRSHRARSAESEQFTSKEKASLKEVLRAQASVTVREGAISCFDAIRNIFDFRSVVSRVALDLKSLSWSFVLGPAFSGKARPEMTQTNLNFWVTLSVMESPWKRD